MTTGAEDGRNGGSFSSPARPNNFTPDRTGGGFHQGVGPASDNTDALGTKDHALEPVRDGERGNLNNRYSFDSMLDLDDGDESMPGEG